MIILARLLVAIVVNLMFEKMVKPPNDTDQSDKIIDDKVTNDIKNRRKMFIVHAIRSTITLYHLYYCIYSSFSIFEMLCLFFLFFGFFLRIWSFQTLGHFFTFDLCIRKDHLLITEGPYKYLMHPSYTGLILFIFSGLLYFGIHYLLAIIYLLFGCYQFKKRMDNEEKMLEEKFGQEFKDYAKKRWRLVPYIY